jgi:cation/acetate symporter
VIYEFSPVAAGVFIFFVLLVLGISFYLGSKAKSAQGYFAAHGQIHWFVNGIAFAGDYLSAASFLGICGYIAFGGYDGFLYSIGFLAGWIVALFVIAEPLKRLGKFTFADALDKQFHSSGIKLSAAISTLVVSIFYLIPQMVGAGALIKPLLGLQTMYGVEPHAIGVVGVGTVVILIVVTAGMVSTTWVQFIKGTLLVVFCALLTIGILQRGFDKETANLRNADNFAPLKMYDRRNELPKTFEELPRTGDWAKDAYKQYVRMKDSETGVVHIFRPVDAVFFKLGGNLLKDVMLMETQYKTVSADKQETIVNGLPHGKGEGQADFKAVGNVFDLPLSSVGNASDVGTATGPLGPLQFFAVLQEADIIVWQKELPITDEDGSTTTIYYPQPRKGADLLTPGSSKLFEGVRSADWKEKLDFLSLMLALFCGTASLPHILIRYYTVKDQASARKSTVVGIAAIGFFYVLTLYLGFGAMTSGVLDPTDQNMAAPLLARSFSEFAFAVISAIAFTTVLGTVSGLILAAAGAVSHDLASNLFRWQLSDHEKVRVAKISAIFVGIIAMALGIWFKNFNVSFLVGWAFNVAASANLPALVMLLFWKRTTKQGITAAILVGMISSLAWILLSQQAYNDVYGWKLSKSIIPFSQPALVTIPLGFLVLIVVSLLTKRRAE